jgi:hypothetical protein
MRVESDVGGFIIVRGWGRKEQYFCFLVDGDKACWTRAHPWEAAKFESTQKADEYITELRRRAKIRRETPKEFKQCATK